MRYKSKGIGLWPVFNVAFVSLWPQSNILAVRSCGLFLVIPDHKCNVVTE